MFLSFDPSYAAIQSQLTRALSQIATSPLGQQVSALLKGVVGDGFNSSSGTGLKLPSALYSPPSTLAERSGSGAERTQTYAQRATTMANLDAKSGSGVDLNAASGRGTDYVSANQGKYLPQLSPEQAAMWHLQQEVNRQAEAAGLMAAIEKARHDAMMAIIQKIG